MAVNLLVSYAFAASRDLAAIRRDLICGLLMVDSGAFSVHTKGTIHRKGGTIELGAYAEYLEQWAGCWDHAVTLDVIGDPVATAANTRKLHARGLPVMPVFTLGGTLADFDAMVRDVGYVCVGGLVSGMPASAQVARVKMLQRRARDTGGGIHALGVGSLRTLRTARPYSSDSSAMANGFKFGYTVYFDGREIRKAGVTERPRLIRDCRHIHAHDLDLAGLARLGRMPREDETRPELIRAMILAYAAADEALKRSPVPAPGTLDASDGPHLYMVAAKMLDAMHIARADRALHTGSPTTTTGWRPPPIWAAYGATHTCRRREAARVS